VDLYNAVSLRYAVPVGGENSAAYCGSPRLVFADGSETFDTLNLLPMYAIRKAPSLAKYRGRLDNVFVTLIGLLTILNIVYKLF
ncbi:hypothetical protein MJL79_30330, partial [Salmonella enterica subsp. enterica serovar Montevideo]|nr:hypothetical protein [Salmonella enterica subsp. enterica serovar Montevideo]